MSMRSTPAASAWRSARTPTSPGASITVEATAPGPAAVIASHLRGHAIDARTTLTVTAAAAGTRP